MIPSYVADQDRVKPTEATSPSPKKDAGIFITKVGLLTNVTMAVVKGVLGYALSSKTMMADALHGATDAMSDIIALVAIMWGSRPPTNQFPYGHGKIESLGALGVSAILLVGGFSMGLNSLHFLLKTLWRGKHPINNKLAHEEAHIGTLGCSDGGLLSHMFVIGISLATIVAKEWLYSATMKLSMERGSTVLASNALHHRIDSFTEVIIICVILASKLIQDAAWLDPVVGLFISLMAVRPAAEFTMSALRELSDYTIGEEINGEVRLCSEEILRDIDKSGKVKVISIMGTKSGQKTLISLEMIMPGNWTINEASELEGKFHTELNRRVQITCHAQVHVRPVE
ncbi:Cation efflux [Fusarium pseudoanthophilum]|uniref:Cation efflux n=1 Tax=Fusarium pseudoanthophilum TaxID=48495 RepID=A0A8H5NYC4_9HYPO|nr:Cation efflux [Fusarium pseudoanthophilum]